MQFRPGAAVTLFIVIGAAVSAGPAVAQYYPPGPPAYGPYVSPPPYRPQNPPPDVDDIGPGEPFGPPGAGGPPPGYSTPPGGSAEGTPYPGGPVLTPQDAREWRDTYDRPPEGLSGPRPPGDIGSSPQQTIAALPPEYRPETGARQELPPRLRRQMVDYQTREPAGTIIIDTPDTYLYLVLGRGKALRYGIGVGREGFTWSGTERIRRMSEWPDWYPPAEMIQRQPYLPRMMAGGPGNPLGARALYLGNTLYRIHGTNQPSTIGQTVSSGCIRLLNDDIEDLFGRVTVGTRVVVLPGHPPSTAAATR